MKRILAIDDNEEIRNLLSKFLTSMGYEVETGANGGEGIRHIDNGNTFDLVITDLQMPVVDGVTLAEYIRNSNLFSTPIVAITGHKDYPMKNGLFDKVLLKPFKLETLFEVVKTLI